MLPEFNKVTIEKCIAAVGKQSIEFEQGIKALEKDVQGRNCKNNLYDSNLCKIQSL